MVHVLDMVLTFMDLINQGIRESSVTHPARVVEQNCQNGQELLIWGRKKSMRKAS